MKNTTTREKALMAISEYQQTVEKHSDCGPIEEHILHLFDTCEFASTPQWYEILLDNFITGVATNKELADLVEKEVGNYNYKDFVKMLAKFRDFCSTMGYDYFQS